MKTCLRCEWEGEERGPACPRCGAPLYLRAGTSAPAARRRGLRRGRRERTRTEPTDAETRTSSRRSEPAAEADTGATRERRWRTAIPVAAVIVAVVVAVILVRRTTPVTLGPAQGADLGGVIVYAARVDDGWRLYRWRLRTGTVSEGPFLAERPVELVHASDAGEGVLGTVQEGADGLLAARVLRHLDPQDRAATLLRDRFVAWAPEGSTAVAATTIGTQACRDLVLRQWVLDRGEEEEFFRGEICGEVRALGRSFSTTFVTATDGPKLATLGIEPSGRAVSWVRGWGLVGVSRRGTQLLVPTGELPVSSPQPLGRFAGSQGLLDEPTMYGLDGEELRFEALLGWAGGDAGAYVLGTYGGERGVYLVAVDEGGGGKFPPFLAAPLEAGVPSLTETGDGVAVLALDGRWYRVRDGSLQALEPPEGAPAPEGPIVWIPSVPDSAGEVV